jgi:hypothetical protein
MWLKLGTNARLQRTVLANKDIRVYGHPRWPYDLFRAEVPLRIIGALSNHSRVRPCSNSHSRNVPRVPKVNR